MERAARVGGQRRGLGGGEGEGQKKRHRCISFKA
jgi:hypothetical protein